MIRITGGFDRSRLLVTPDTSLTKPTMDKVRQAVFSSLGDAIKNANVLDLFAGSGSYGFEALSRGASKATFVDKSHLAISCIKKNAENLRKDNVDIFNQDVLSFLSNTKEQFDIVFVDPPYKLDIYQDVLKTLLENALLTTSGIIVLESENELDININLFRSVKLYKYGTAKIYILRK